MAIIISKTCLRVIILICSFIQPKADSFHLLWSLIHSQECCLMPRKCFLHIMTKNIFFLIINHISSWHNIFFSCSQKTNCCNKKKEKKFFFTLFRKLFHGVRNNRFRACIILFLLILVSTTIIIVYSFWELQHLDRNFCRWKKREQLVDIQ